MNLLNDSDHDHHHDGTRRTSGFTKFVYFVFVLNVLAFLLLIIGAIAGWFRLDAGRIADGTFRMGLVVDGTEVSSDIGDTMNAASNLSETAKSATGLQTLDGKLDAVDLEQKQLTLSTDGKVHKILVTDATEFKGDGTSDLADLHVGELLRVTVQTKNDRLFAVKVTEKTTETETE